MRAYELLVRQYQDVAFRTAYFITGTAADAAPFPRLPHSVPSSGGALLRAFSRLHEEDRLVIPYRYFYDRNEAEMATALDCAPSSTRTRTV